MTERVDATRPPAADPYSPQLRTALVLTGTGTDGAYHAGVLRALHEAGVKIDLVGARGVGVVGALFAAVDGGQRLWDDKGFWMAPEVRALYGWRTIPRIAILALAVSLAVVALPVAAIALGFVVFPIDFFLKTIGAGGAQGLVGWYVQLAQRAFAPDMLPTWLPRIVLLILSAVAVLAVAAARTRPGRASRGGLWWRIVRPPIAAAGAVDLCWRAMWDLVRGAAALKQPPAADLSRRYLEMLADNLGQPGFRELLFVVHDVDAHRDLVFALVADGRRGDLVRRPTSRAADARRAEVFDLAGVARDLLPDAVAGALAVPLATEWHTATFAPDGYWRGESHRLGDRPASLVRLVDELVAAGVQQIVVVSAAHDTPGPHALSAARADGRGRLGEYLRSAEAAIVRDATTTWEGVRIFTIRPVHNPIGPFDFDGGYDDRSQRRQTLVELMNRGYEDAYRQFIEPVVGASGETVGI